MEITDWVQRVRVMKALEDISIGFFILGVVAFAKSRYGGTVGS